MTEPVADSATERAAGSPDTMPTSSGAGGLLRAARQAQGLHIAALAAAIKVTPAKLEALEAGRFEQLPDMTFVRALALTVCRQLHIDPAPVLAQLPGAPASRLERVDSGLNTPFRERPGHVDPAAWVPWRRPVPWLVLVLLVAAASFVLVPMRGAVLPVAQPASAPQPVMPPSPEASAPLVGAAPAPAMPVIETVAVPASDTANAASTGSNAASAPLASADLAVVRAVQDTWLQVTDAGGQVLTARLVPAGETVELAGALPLKLKIGNVRGTELRFRGQPVDLSAAARDNVANLTLP